MDQKEKDKQLKRMVKIADSLEAMHEKAEIEDRDLSENEQKNWDSMIKEYDGLRNTFDTLKGPEVKTLEDVRANMKLPVNELHKSNPGGQLINENGEEIRTFNKDNLSELRSYILSQGKLGMGNEELSLGRAIRAIATGNWGFAPAEARALGTATLGGQYWIPSEMSAKVIELSLAAAQVFKSGASVTPMSTKTLTCPKVLTMPEAEWKAENVAYAGSLSASFEPVVLTAKSVVSILSLSIELAEDGVGVEKAIEQMLAKSISQEIDRACLLGTGSDNEPKGIANTTGILTEEWEAAGDIAYSNLSSAFYKLEAVNNSPNSLIMASSLLGTLDALVDLQEQPLKPPPSYEKYAKLPSNQLTEQGILGLYSNLLVGLRTNLNLEVSRVAESALTEMKILIRAFARMDCTCKIANSFCLIKEAAA